MKNNFNFRELKIFFFYNYFLKQLNPNVATKELMINSLYSFTIFELEQVEDILVKTDLIQQEIENKLVDWEWALLNAIDRALIINGVYELLFLKKKKAIVINEYIDLAKRYGSLDETFRLLNGILDKL